MNLLKRWRDATWQKVDADVYQEAFNLFGGSVVTDPKIVKAVCDIAEIPVRFLARYEKNKLIGAIAAWKDAIAGHKPYLRKVNKQRYNNNTHMLDIGNAEVILPLDSSHQFKLRYKCHHLSILSKNSIEKARKMPNKKATISLLKHYGNSSDYNFSKKFKYNLRRQLRLFHEAGGYYQPVTDFSPEAFTQMYDMLFQKRWNHRKSPRGITVLPRFLTQIKTHHKGFILFNADKTPIAIQLILQSESPKWISVEYINGGFDPDFKHLNPGTVLTYLNSLHAFEHAEKNGKALRYSFGLSDEPYKDLWCYRSNIYRVNTLF